MTSGIASSVPALTKRLERFIDRRSTLREEIGEVVQHLNVIGNVVVFGGAVRDMARHGNRVVPRDVDIVIVGADGSKLERRLAEFRPERNRFGGYRFALRKWKFDVWRIEDTWAIREGAIVGTDVSALVQTTFFDWDGIAYDVSAGRLYFLEHYFQKLASGILGLNLVVNPNPVGNVMRAIRAFRSEQVTLSPLLGAEVVKVVKRNGAEAISSAEAQSYRERYLTTRREVELTVEYIEKCLAKDPEGAVRPVSLQRELVW